MAAEVNTEATSATPKTADGAIEDPVAAQDNGSTSNGTNASMNNGMDSTAHDAADDSMCNKAKRGVLGSSRRRASSFVYLTSKEHNFLQELSMVGTDSEIELAWERLHQEELMFMPSVAHDATTKPAELSRHDADSTAAATTTATTTTAATATTTATDVEVKANARPPLPRIPKPTSFASNAAGLQNGDVNGINSQDSVHKKMGRSTSVGSARRNQVLQQRRQQQPDGKDSPHVLLWKAHEQGLGTLVTTSNATGAGTLFVPADAPPHLWLQSQAKANQRDRSSSTNQSASTTATPPTVIQPLPSTLRIPQRRRNSSHGSNSNSLSSYYKSAAAPGANKRLSFCGSVHSTTSAASSLTPDDMHRLHAAAHAIFRSKVQRRSIKLPASVTLQQRLQMQQQQRDIPTAKLRRKFQRSQSLTVAAASFANKTMAASRLSPMPKRSSMSKSQFGALASQPMPLARRGRTKSVTFSEGANDGAIPTPTPTFRRPKLLARRQSDTLAYASSSSLPIDDAPVPTSQPSTARLARIASDAGSIASFASIRPATAIRSDSSTTVASIGNVSIPPIQPATALRSQSTATVDTFPPIPPGKAMRGNSISTETSIPPIQPATAIRSESTATNNTFPPLPPGVVMRGESVATNMTNATIPSIRHATALRSQSTISTDSELPLLQNSAPATSSRVQSTATTATFPPIQPATAVRSESSTATFHDASTQQSSGVVNQDDTPITAPTTTTQLCFRDAVVTIPPPPSVNAAEILRAQYEASDQVAMAWATAGNMSSFATSTSQSSQTNSQHDQEQQQQNPPLDHVPATIPTVPTAATMPSAASTVTTIESAATADSSMDLDTMSQALPSSTPSDAKMPSLTTEEHDAPTGASDTPTAKKSPPKPVLLRLASRNNYDGEGVEVSESPSNMLQQQQQQGSLQATEDATAHGQDDDGQDQQQEPVVLDYTDVDHSAAVENAGSSEGAYHHWQQQLQQRAQQQPPQSIIWFSRLLSHGNTPMDQSHGNHYLSTSFDESSYYHYKDGFQNQGALFNQDAHDDIFRIRRAVSHDNDQSFIPEIIATTSAPNLEMSKYSSHDPLDASTIGTQRDPEALSHFDTQHAHRMHSEDGDTDDDDDDDDYQDSWDMSSVPDNERFDSWNIMKDDYANGYGGGGTLGFSILGTSADDVAASPHVLSPPLMESLQGFFPFSKNGENFYLKYSLVRDGASLGSFLQHARGAQYTILALETVDGEVFGAFTGQAWRKTWKYFGTGECFLWRMRNHRLAPKSRSVLEQAQLESEIDVFPYAGANDYIQLCTSDRLAVGWGTPADSTGPMPIPTVPSSSSSHNFYDDDDGGQEAGEKKEEYPHTATNYTSTHLDTIGGPATGSSGLDTNTHTSNNNSDRTQQQQQQPDWGFGLVIEGDDLLHGTTSPCLTFNSPSLSKVHSDGTKFEIVNLELWTLTPCSTEAEAEKLELSRLFLERHAAWP